MGFCAAAVMGVLVAAFMVICAAAFMVISATAFMMISATTLMGVLVAAWRGVPAKRRERKLWQSRVIGKKNIFVFSLCAESMLEQKSKPMVFPRPGKTVIIVIAVLSVLAGLRAWQLYGYVFKANVQKNYVLYITEKTSFDMVVDSLETHHVMKNMKAFKWVARRKECRDYIKAGRYHFREGMSANQVVNILRSGLQEPVNLTFNNIRTPEQLAGVVSRTLLADSLSIMGLFDREVIGEYGFTPETFPAMFIPNTYEFYWTTTARQFGDRMKKEYDAFWNEARLKKAAELNMTPVEVATLASILQEETNKLSEKPRIAGVYLNRLRKGMLLQADPTVKFAVGDITLRRILHRHLDTDSPYNTYLYPGLPPGPITFPEIQSIDAVLNYETHNLYYFCAREDFSGYHNFARTHAEHERNAARYHAALDSAWRARREAREN